MAVILLRVGPDAIVRLLAGTVAVLTRDEKRGERALKVLRIPRNQDTGDSPPSPLDGLGASAQNRRSSAKALRR